MFVYKRGKNHFPPLHSYYSSALHVEELASTQHPRHAATLSLPLLTMVIDGRKERVQFDKITARVSRLCYGLDPEHVDAAAITMKVISGVYQGVTTIELDNLVRSKAGRQKQTR